MKPWIPALCCLAAGLAGAEPTCGLVCAPAGWTAAATMAPPGTRPVHKTGERTVQLTLAEPAISAADGTGAWLDIVACCEATVIYTAGTRELLRAQVVGRRQWRFGGEPAPDAPCLPGGPWPDVAAARAAWTGIRPGMEEFLGSEARRMAVTRAAAAIATPQAPQP